MTIPEQFAIRRRIEIDAAHRIPDHRSKCFSIHGHRYVIEATLVGNLVQKGEQSGMVMDFSFIKECMNTAIHDQCDHGIIFYKNDPILETMLTQGGNTVHVIEQLARGNYLRQRLYLDELPGWKLYIIECVPTAENLAFVWYEELKLVLSRWHEANMDPNFYFSSRPRLKEVRVWETPNCVAWYPLSESVDPQT